MHGTVSTVDSTVFFMLLDCRWVTFLVACFCKLNEFWSLKRQLKWSVKLRNRLSMWRRDYLCDRTVELCEKNTNESWYHIWRKWSCFFNENEFGWLVSSSFKSIFSIRIIKFLFHFKVQLVIRLLFLFLLAPESLMLRICRLHQKLLIKFWAGNLHHVHVYMIEW